jgi:hypothetical protein
MTDDKLQRQLAGWALLPSVQAERAEHRRQEMRAQREHEQRREQDARERQRLAALEREWRTFKTGVAQAQQEQQRRAALQRRAQLLDEFSLLVRPPQPQPAEQIYYLPSEGTAQLGFVDFNPELMSRPLRWW